jgi:hypothetical protein
MKKQAVVKIGFLQKVGMMIVAKILHELYCDYSANADDVIVKDWCGTHHGEKGAFRLFFKFVPGESCNDCKLGGEGC